MTGRKRTRPIVILPRAPIAPQGPSATRPRTVDVDASSFPFGPDAAFDSPSPRVIGTPSSAPPAVEVPRTKSTAVKFVKLSQTSGRRYVSWDELMDSGRFTCESQEQPVHASNADAMLAPIAMKIRAVPYDRTPTTVLNTIGDHFELFY
jgi:hypothetical protein